MIIACAKRLTRGGIANSIIKHMGTVTTTGDVK